MNEITGLNHSLSDRHFPDLSRLLNPRSVAVIGASDRSGNLGGETVKHLRKFGFSGPVWPVNPNAESVAGLPCAPSVAALPETPDVVILAVSASEILKIIKECVAVGSRCGVAYAGGFAEAGAGGAELQHSLVEYCRKAGFALCGPNCLGIINTADAATLSFSTTLYEAQSLRKGMISMVSQSGGIATVAMSMAAQLGFGFHKLISSGNEAILTFPDYIHALAVDEGTKVIAGYFEGVTDGPRFLAALGEARRRNKPVVLIKAGTTDVSARAALAHTGAMVGNERVVDAVLQEMGVIRARSMGELVDVCITLAGTPEQRSPAGPGVGIVSFGGGFGVLAADQCAHAGLKVPALQPDCIARLKPLLVSVASASNPLDLTPTTALRAESLAKLPEALDVAASEQNIDCVLFIIGGLAARAKELREIILDFWKRSPKPVYISWPSPPNGVIEWLAERGVPVFEDPARLIWAIGRLASLAEMRARPIPRGDIQGIAINWRAAVPEAAALVVVSEDRCHAILAAAALPVAAARLVMNETAAREAARAIGMPVVLKAISPDVTHRAAAGLLAMDLRTEDEVVAAYRHLAARAHEMKIRLDGIYVQRIHKAGIELLVAAVRDPMFGIMITCGHGGGMAELIDTVVVNRAPVDIPTAADMLKRLQLGKGTGGADPLVAADFIAHFSQLAATAPFRCFTFEINPIKWSSEGVIAVDGLLVVEQD